VAAPEYARLNTGVSITRANSGNGAQPTRGSEEAGNDYHVRQVTDARTSPPLCGNDRLPVSNWRGLRRNTVRESVGMKISVVTHTGPGTVLPGSLRHTVFFTGGKVVP
jgi:hypothetical protein